MRIVGQAVLQVVKYPPIRDTEASMLKVSPAFPSHWKCAEAWRTFRGDRLHFIYNNLNMCKIESRPIENRNWEYRFFIDFEGNLADSAVKNALRGLRDEARNMKILGNY